MRNKITFTLLVLACSFNTNAQNVGINATGAAPAASAMLDITATNRGLLIPRVNLTGTGDVTTIAAPATSLLVYNQATAGAGATAVTPGYYYYNGSAWVRFFDGSSWNLTGNAGTSAATNFIGTTDNVDWVIRTNNIERARFSTTPQFLLNSNGTAAAPIISWSSDPNTGIFHSTLTDDIGISTNGLVRFNVSDAGEVYCGATAPVLPGDLFNVTASNTNAVTSGSGNLTWAINGYTAFNGGSVYGLRLPGSTGTWGAGQFELVPGLPAASRGVSGSAGSNNHYGSFGTKPAGGGGFGGLFINDLGYSGGFFFVSDPRLKEQVKPLSNASDLINKIDIYSFKFKTKEYDVLGDENQVHYGVMANELKLVLPDLVKSKILKATPSKSGNLVQKDIEGEIEMVNYLELVPITIQALKEQQKEIADLKKIIAEQQEQINRMLNNKK